MPAPSRWMIRAAIIYLITGFLFGTLMLIGKGISDLSFLWKLLPLHIEILIFGWIIQFTMGTAYWILPRYLEGPARGNPHLPKIMVVLFNSGILVNLATALDLIPAGGYLWGRLLEVGAVGIFIFLHWGRAVSYSH